MKQSKLKEAFSLINGNPPHLENCHDAIRLIIEALQTDTKKNAVLERFEEAVRAHAFIGAAHPRDAKDIEREYQLAKAALLQEL